MPSLPKKNTRETLDSLRRIRRKLYSIPEVELNAMSLEDQAVYGESLYRTGSAILKLEIAKLKGANAAFVKQSQKLKTATAKLEKDLSGLEDTVEVIRVIGKGVSLVADIIKLLG